MIDSYEDFKKQFLGLSGIDLHSYKENQMKRRINSFISKHNCDRYSDFIRQLKNDKELYDQFITYLTINVSEFYRNPTQWKTLETEVFPYLTKMFGNKLKIWSAACSTGDEPYSLAMVLSDFIPLSQIQIIATDLDKEVLDKAKKGYYQEKSIRGLPEKYRKKYIEDDGSGVIRVKQEIRNCVTFKEHNLLKDTYESGFHLIVCRNVLIYFTEEAKDEVYYKFAKAMKPDGILFVGSTEQIIGCEKYGFNAFRSFFYQKL
ncbi:MAG: protein-glutamate O-methyltransferase CheR [Lachnospiraceae bacterium]|nr:protein-glutamate O-methyltransferase CheR [Lachnospiraceae bacterium]